MVKHIIIWTLKDEYDDIKKAQIKADVKKNLEGLYKKIEGLVQIKVQIDKLPSSSGDLMLDSTFESTDALKAYATHPEHVRVADTYVRPFVAHRSCLDFEI